MRKVMLPLDGFKSFEKLKEKLNSFLGIKGFWDIVSHIKLNDAVYSPEGCTIVKQVTDWLQANDLGDIKIFLDLKLSDTSGTNANILKQYTTFGIYPDVITVRECCSVETFREIRKLMPNTVIALVSILTDTSEEECYARYEMSPKEKLKVDIETLLEIADNPFDAVVCSPNEVVYLKYLFPTLQFIVPGIRDVWMNKGQQERTAGVRQALEAGADFVVMGSQLTNGNPDAGISAEKSVEMTFAEMAKAQTIIPDNPFQTLVNFDAVYVSPKDASGNWSGPLVAYAGKGEDGKPKVGYHYYNMARIEENPRAMYYFACQLADRLVLPVSNIDVVLGAPNGGIALAQVLSHLIPARFAFAEKKVVSLGDPVQNTKDIEELVIKRHTINPGDKVLIVEDLCNNFSTTNELKKLIESFGAEVTGVACIVNRSCPLINSFEGLPIVSVVELETQQYEQTDPKVQEHLLAGNIVLKPKHNWSDLKQAMKNMPDAVLA